jgi:hypothetical protein
MKNDLSVILELSYNDNFKSEITIDQILLAKKYINTLPKNTNELLMVILSMNLINAALKRNEYKSKEKDAIIYYGMLKPKVSRLLNYMLEIDYLKFDCQFYINTREHCAYIEVEGLQSSFHNISITENLQAFIDSEKNEPKPWKGVRLQKIAGELFDYFSNKKGATL